MHAVCDLCMPRSGALRRVGAKYRRCEEIARFREACICSRLRYTRARRRRWAAETTVTNSLPSLIPTRGASLQDGVEKTPPLAASRDGGNGLSIPGESRQYCFPGGREGAILRFNGSCGGLELGTGGVRRTVGGCQHKAQASDEVPAYLWIRVAGKLDPRLRRLFNRTGVWPGVNSPICGERDGWSFFRSRGGGCALAKRIRSTSQVKSLGAGRY
jgi:hypothetical protein